MPDEPDLDEDGFPIYRPSPEEIAATKARMNTLVDCRKLASEMISRLPDPDPALLEELARDFGLDGTKTLTEIEGEDLGDVCDVADEAIVHALRYVPVARWSVADIRLMLAYGHGIDVGLALAELALRSDPMVEAEHFPGDLLRSFSALAISRGKDDLVRELVARMEARIWADFDRYATEAKLGDEETRSARLRLQNGHRSPPGRNPFLDTEHDLETLAEVLDDILPPEHLCQAQAKQLFARYRPRKSVELVPLPDLEHPDYRAKIDHPDTFKFRRDTTFRIAKDQSGIGVRLRITSPSAINHVQGIWYDDLDAAKTAAMRDYSVPKDGWADG